jgi:hypothetical protein
VKQVGARPYTDHWNDGLGDHEMLWLDLDDRHGGDPSEWPAGDWPREFPRL